MTLQQLVDQMPPEEQARMRALREQARLRHERETDEIERAQQQERDWLRQLQDWDGA